MFCCVASVIYGRVFGLTARQHQSALAGAVVVVLIFGAEIGSMDHQAALLPCRPTVAFQEQPGKHQKVATFSKTENLRNKTAKEKSILLVFTLMLVCFWCLSDRFSPWCVFTAVLSGSRCCAARRSFSLSYKSQRWTWGWWEQVRTREQREEVQTVWTGNRKQEVFDRQSRWTSSQKWIQPEYYMHRLVP